MRKLLCIAALALSGCGSVAPDVDVKMLYTPSMFGGVIGQIIRVTDAETGFTVYYIVGQNGSTVLGTIKTK